MSLTQLVKSRQRQVLHPRSPTTNQKAIHHTGPYSEVSCAQINIDMLWFTQRRSRRNIRCDAHITAIDDHFAEWPAEREAWRRRADRQLTYWTDESSVTDDDIMIKAPLSSRLFHMNPSSSPLKRFQGSTDETERKCFVVEMLVVTITWGKEKCSDTGFTSRYRFCEFLTWINGYYVFLFMYFQVYSTLPVWMLCYICVWSYSSLFPFMDFHF